MKVEIPFCNMFKYEWQGLFKCYFLMGGNVLQACKSIVASAELKVPYTDLLYSC